MWEREPTPAWIKAELERRLAAEAYDEPLLPPEEFTDTYASAGAEADPARGRDAPTIHGIVAGSCAGWGRPPTPAEVYDAMRAESPSSRQIAVASVIASEATVEELLSGYLEGAFTWRQIVRAMHRSGIQRSKVTRYLNETATGCDRRTDETGPDR